MSRMQKLTAGTTINLTVPGPAVPLSATSLKVKSVIIQAKVSNADFVFVGDSVAQLQALEPRRSLKIWGDNLDHGTAALIDLAEIYVSGLINGDGVTFTYLEGGN